MGRKRETRTIVLAALRAKHMPHLIGVLGDRSDVFFGGLNIVEQAKLNRAAVSEKRAKLRRCPARVAPSG